MGSNTPILDVLVTHLPAAISTELSALSSSQSRSTVEALLAFALGGDCPTRLPNTRQQWSHGQPGALKALRDHLGTRYSTKRARDSTDDDAAAAPKRQKTGPIDITDDGRTDLSDDPPLFTLPNISTTSPVRKKVDVTVHARSIRFTHLNTRALEATIPLAHIARAFLLPTRGKSRGHWTVVLLPADVPDKAKTASSSAQQVIFGLDALSTAEFETRSYSSGASTPNSTGFTPTTTTTVAKGEETAASVRKFLSYISAPLYEPSATVFRSACAAAKAGNGAAGIDAYLAAKAGTLWFFDTGILWGESKPCEFWAVSDLAAKDGVRLTSATGRTCSVTLSRKHGSGEWKSADDDEEEEKEVVETTFSMVDGREQDPIHAWARNRKYLFGKSPVGPSISASTSKQASGHNKEAGPSSQRPNGTIQGPAWDDSDPDDDDFEATSEDLDSPSEEDESGSGVEDGSQSEGVESGEEASDAEEAEEELREARHPLLRPGAVPRMTKAAMNLVVDMLRDDLGDDGSEEEDQLEE